MLASGRSQHDPAVRRPRQRHPGQSPTQSADIDPPLVEPAIQSSVTTLIVRILSVAMEVLADYEGDAKKPVFSILMDTRPASTTRRANSSENQEEEEATESVSSEGGSTPISWRSPATSRSSWTPTSATS